MKDLVTVRAGFISRRLRGEKWAGNRTMKTKIELESMT